MKFRGKFGITLGLEGTLWLTFGSVFGSNFGGNFGSNFGSNFWSNFGSIFLGALLEQFLNFRGKFGITLGLERKLFRSVLGAI